MERRLLRCRSGALGLRAAGSWIVSRGRRVISTRRQTLRSRECCDCASPLPDEDGGGCSSGRPQASSRLEVVAADDDPRTTKALGEEDFRRAIHLLERHYNLVCLDTGTGVLESATQGILDEADQIVVVVAPSLDGARAASSTLD